VIAFEVKDMTCGHCAQTITEAVKAVDVQAKVHIDLANHRVEIEASAANAQALSEIIKEAGYTPATMATDKAPVIAKARGCCCS
jgi:copper chaperone